MFNNYFSFLDYRAARRRIESKLARPRWLLLHIALFLTAITGFAAYGWYFGAGFASDWFPAIVGAGWSGGLALHAVISFLRSGAWGDTRENAVEAEMRDLVEQHQTGDPAYQDDLFTLHRQLEDDVKRRAWFFYPLGIFALANVAIWGMALLSSRPSFAFGFSVALAIFIIGSMSAFEVWRRARADGERTGKPNWIARLPAGHFLLYVIGSFFLTVIYGGFEVWILWTLALILHTLYSLFRQPKPRSAPVVVPPRVDHEVEKGKRAGRLALADDGEVLEIVDDEWEAPRRARR